MGCESRGHPRLPDNQPQMLGSSESRQFESNGETKGRGQNIFYHIRTPRVPGRDVLCQKKALSARLGTTSLCVVHRDHVGHFDLHTHRGLNVESRSVKRSGAPDYHGWCIAFEPASGTVQYTACAPAEHSGVTFRFFETCACHSLVTTHSGVLAN